MANDNLKGYGFHERTAEEQQEIARKGGIASGETRRWKNAIKKIITDQNSEQMMEELLVTYKKTGADGKVKILTYLRDTEGEKPIDKVEADINSSLPPPKITLEIVGSEVRTEENKKI